MSIESSPLRDRVIFIEGAPRSGTTWLLSLLATSGVDRLFDNFEMRHAPLQRPQRWLERD